MSDVFSRVLDAIDIETFLICKSEEEGRQLSKQLMLEIGFQDLDIVFIEHRGPGVRVRLRGYIHRPGDQYGWLKT